MNKSPTYPKVIRDTLDKSLKLIEERQQKYAEIHYDLAIAPKAFRIIWAYPQQYKNCFVHIGLFHFEMAFSTLWGRL